MDTPTPELPSDNAVLRKVATIDLGNGITLDDFATHLSMSNQGGIQTLTVVLNIPAEMSDEEAMALRAQAMAAVNSMGANIQVNISLSTHSEVPKLKPIMKSEPKPKAKKQRPKGVKKTLLVGGGTRGAGTSTLAQHLAYFMLAQGLRVGLSEVAINAPSISQRTGIDKIRELNEEGMVRPHMHNGLAMTSLGFAMTDSIAQMAPPLNVEKEIHSLTHGVEWGDLDLLLVDARSISDSKSLLAMKDTMHFDGALMIAAPHENVIDHTQRSISLIKDMNAPILGIVGNQVKPSTGPNFFGEGEAADDYFAEIKQVANGHDIDYLGHVPHDPRLIQAPSPNKPKNDFINKIGWKLMPLLSF